VCDQGISMHSRILLIVSDPTVAKYLRALIGSSGGAGCHVATTLEEGLARLEAGGYGLAVIDVDPLSDRARQRASELSNSCPGLKVVGLGSLPEHGLRGGFDVVIQKPFVAEPLLAALSDRRLEVSG